MSQGLLRRAIMVFTASLFLAVAFSGSAYAASQLGAPGARPATAARTAGSSGDSLAALMLRDADLPAGFQPYAPLTGQLDARRAKLLGTDISLLGSQAGWARDWISALTGEAVLEIVVDDGTREMAQTSIKSFSSIALKKGLTKEHIAGPGHFTAFKATGQLNGTGYLELDLPLARGPYFFYLRVLAPVQSSASALRLAGDLAVIQANKVPGNAPDTGTGSADPAQAAGFATGGLVLTYVGILNGIAYFRNPLRGARRRARFKVAGPRSEGFEIRDVSIEAQRNRRTAIWRLAVQIIGLCLIAYGADVFQVPHGYVYLAIGVATIWAGGRFIRPGGASRDKNRAILAGPRKIRVAAMLSIGSALVLLGLISCIAAGLEEVQSQGLMQNAQSAAASAQDLESTFFLIGFSFVALGAVMFRRARRVGSIDAHELMLRDPRPPVLYLRSFGDDRLRLMTATLGRSSLIERFTPRRFDSFEEVLVRYLSLRGPVIAVNPPGTKLPPLGAARETIDSADWQSAITAWMKQCALIVFVAPPSQVTQGLQWELQTVSANRHWDKALVIVPPVSPERLEQRWQALLGTCAGLWPFTVPLPADDPRALALAFRQSEWKVIIANRRTEWSYSAALKEALDASRPLAPVDESRPVDAPRAAATRLLTPPVVALAAVLAAAAGVGSWYAVGKAPAARTSAIAKPSSTRDSRPQPSQSTPAVSRTSPRPSPRGPQTSPANGLVTLSPAAAQYPYADSLQAMITEYFQAIDDRDYAEYAATQSAGMALTPSQFETGFRSTADSSVLVTNIATAPDGRPEADVTFTSRQQPQDGPQGESCTNWQVKMFFDGNDGTYTIGAPPADYRASYQPCT
jgi:hypothetical protein